jgi:hypothetical protein
MRKSNKMTIGFFLFWFSCGLLGAGFMNAYFKNKFPILDSPLERRQNLGIACVLGLAAGPVMLLVSIPLSGFAYYGWDLSLGPPHTKDKE